MNHTIVMTGAMNGLGHHAALDLLRDDPRLHLVVIARGAGAAARARDLTTASGSSRVSVVTADLASLAEVRAAAAQIVALLHAGDLPPLDGIVGNAGAQFTTAANSTPEGYEPTFALRRRRPRRLGPDRQPQ